MSQSTSNSLAQLNVDCNADRNPLLGIDWLRDTLLLPAQTGRGNLLGAQLRIQSPLERARVNTFRERSALHTSDMKAKRFRSTECRVSGFLYPSSHLSTQIAERYGTYSNVLRVNRLRSCWSLSNVDCAIQLARLLGERAHIKTFQNWISMIRSAVFEMSQFAQDCAIFLDG